MYYLLSKGISEARRVEAFGRKAEDGGRGGCTSRTGKAEVN